MNGQPIYASESLGAAAACPLATDSIYMQSLERLANSGLTNDSVVHAREQEKSSQVGAERGMPKQC
jgi:hypothetical protein